MRYVFSFLSVLLVACSGGTDPQQIIDKSISVSGGDKFLHSTIVFDFRGRHYITRRDGGRFSHERVFGDSTETIHDYLTNDGFHREINGVKVSIPDSMAAKYTRSVNSTIYFALLPYGLNDPAVRKKFNGRTTIDDQPYAVVEVTFAKEGGGEDFNDVFLYWIHEKNFTMDYMAYLYYTDGGGLRFRKGFNARNVNGVLFQDFINYQAASDSVSIHDMENLYKQNALEELSRIELTNITVE